MISLYGLTNNSLMNTAGSAQQSKYASRANALQQKRLANGTDTASLQKTGYASGSSNIISASQSYAESIRNSRLKTQDTSTQLKKLKYNFKDISSQILRSKNSTSARQVVSKAKREVMRLKREKASGKYDEDEIQAALDHAKAMERVAKKKAAHLEQEELIKISDKAGSQTLADELKEHPEELGDDAADEQERESDSGQLHDAAAEELEARMTKMQEIAEEQAEALSEELANELSDNMDELMQEMSDEMSAMMDQMNEALEELDILDELMAVPKEMTESDFKLLVTKHRTDEMKEISKADRDYLKVIFDKYDKARAQAASGLGSGASFGGGMGGISASAGVGVSVSVPDVSVSAAPAAGGIDISV